MDPDSEAGAAHGTDDLLAVFLEARFCHNSGRKRHGAGGGRKQLKINKLVEAAGVEPDHPQTTNWLMAHDFRCKTLIPRRFSPSIESPGVNPSRGDNLETAKPPREAAGQMMNPESRGTRRAVDFFFFLESGFFSFRRTLRSNRSSYPR
jgi:hypothetical protein